ncbi:MAG: divergent polysaccharide deacetylase family protein [Candidatus Zhuqueibacterota bacterium]
MAKKKYNRRKPVKRRRAPATVRKRRTTKETRGLQVAAKIIRFLVLIGICGFILYKLFGPEKKEGPKPPAQKTPVVTPAEEEPIPKEAPVDISSLPKEEALGVVIDEIFKDLNIQKSWVKRSDRYLEVQLPNELPAVTVIWEIIPKVKKMDLKVLDSEENLKTGESTISIGSGKETLLTITFIKNPDLKRHAGKLAFIIDDFGYYDNRTSDNYLSLDYPITLSVIPGQKHSAKIAEKAKQHHKEIMVHIPMEAVEEKVEDSPYTIFADLPKKEIAQRVQKAFASLPDAIGANNHMGSKITGDNALMDVVLTQVQKLDKFFVDSRTTTQTVVPALAKKHHMKYLSNGAFLERHKNEDEDYIRGKIRAAAKIAQKKGTVIVIGHPYKETLDVLKEELPRLEKQGFVIVPVSEIVK